MPCSFANIQQLPAKNRGGAPPGSVATISMQLLNVPGALTVYDIITGIEWYFTQPKLHGGANCRAQIIDVKRNKLEKSFLGQFVWRDAPPPASAAGRGVIARPPAPAASASSLDSSPEALTALVAESLHRRCLWVLSDHYDESGKRSLGSLIIGADSKATLEKLPEALKVACRESTITHQPHDFMLCIPMDMPATTQPMPAGNAVAQQAVGDIPVEGEAAAAAASSTSSATANASLNAAAIPFTPPPLPTVAVGGGRIPPGVASQPLAFVSVGTVPSVATRPFPTSSWPTTVKVGATAAPKSFAGPASSWPTSGELFTNASVGVGGSAVVPPPAMGLGGPPSKSTKHSWNGAPSMADDDDDDDEWFDNIIGNARNDVMA